MCVNEKLIDIPGMAQPATNEPTPTPDNTGTPFGTSSVYRPNSTTLTLNPTTRGSQSGSDNMAKIHRAQWEDYKSRFAPVEDMLFSRFNDETNKTEAVNSAAETMGSAFDRSREQGDRELSRYGLNVSGPKAENRDVTFGLKKAAATAGAKNAMRTAKEDQKMGIMNGGLSTIASQRSN